jgi:hypothetical protein
LRLGGNRDLLDQQSAGRVQQLALAEGKLLVGLETLKGVQQLALAEGTGTLLVGLETLKVGSGERRRR